MQMQWVGSVVVSRTQASPIDAMEIVFDFLCVEAYRTITFC